MKSLFPNQDWTDYLYSQVVAYGLDTMPVKDGAEFGIDGTAESWVHLFAAMAKHESGFNPNQEFVEKDIEGNPVSTGLFQIGYKAAVRYRLYARSPADRATLKGMTSTAKMKDPLDNILLAVIIMARWVKEDGVISRNDGTAKDPDWKGGARYWSVLRDGAPKIKRTLKETTMAKFIGSIPVFGQTGPDVRIYQTALKALGLKKYDPGTVDGEFGDKTKKASAAFQKSIGLKGSGNPGVKTLKALGLTLSKPTEPTPVIPGKPGPVPIYPKPHRFHPRFNVPAPYTHLHPIDVLRSVAGEKEVPGTKDNALIAHFHEHSGNLGSHSDNKNDYADEVPHCSSALNWAADMSGCRKTNNALAASWSKYGNKRTGDFVEVGDVIHIKHPGNHVTMANKRFNKKTAKSFEGFGSNQGNSVKTSNYKVGDIVSVQVWDPLPGTVLAPIGILGTKPTPATGGPGESTT